MTLPIICFGQQPSGFFPKRFLVAKINSAKALQQKIGGKIVFFYHDSDADYRETITLLRDRQSGADVRLNFTQENKVQKKFSPLYLKRVPAGWNEEILKQLPRFADKNLISIFESVNEKFLADFCLEMYNKMGLLDGVEIQRSSDKNFRLSAPDLDKDYFADIPYQGEIVRAQLLDGKFQLHEGGGKYTTIESPSEILKEQKTPGRDQRFAWMNKVINCTHYITGNAEHDYLKRENFPEVEFVKREQIEESDYAWLGSEQR
jgi:hypothetical protein